MPPVTAVAEVRAGETLAATVRRALSAPWTKAKQLCRSGRVLVDGTRERDDARRLSGHERVEVGSTGAPQRPGVLPSEAIAYLDDDVVIVRKPAGVLTVPYDPSDRNTLADQTRAALRRMDRGRRQGSNLGVVQRLDKNTTGLVVFARTLSAKRKLEGLFRKHAIERRYMAIVHGPARDATHDSILVPDRGDGLRGSHGVFRRASGAPPPRAQRAITHVRVLETLRGATLVECTLETGRQHQIRIHLSEAGTPLVGEQVYIRDYTGPRIEAPRPMLHAASLGFEHPRTGRVVRFEDAPPEDFLALLSALGGAWPSPSEENRK